MYAFHHILKYMKVNEVLTNLIDQNKSPEE